MKVIGLTGGIGSGKSSILSIFEKDGIPIFRSDDEAKRILDSDTELASVLVKEFGKNILNEADKPDRKKLAAIVFSNPERLKVLNKQIHPKVAIAFQSFKKRHSKASFVMKEAAILFETGAHLNCDMTILVTAPEEERIRRVVKRDGIESEEVARRIQHQWSDEKKIPLADFVIHNEDWTDTLQQIEKLKTEIGILKNN